MQRKFGIYKFSYWDRWFLCAERWTMGLLSLLRTGFTLLHVENFKNWQIFFEAFHARKTLGLSLHHPLEGRRVGKLQWSAIGLSNWWKHIIGFAACNVNISTCFVFWVSTLSLDEAIPLPAAAEPGKLEDWCLFEFDKPILLPTWNPWAAG